MKTNIAVIIIVAILILPVLGFAATLHTGAYMSGFIGASIPEKADITVDDFFFNKTYSDKVKFDPGINAGLTGGYDFGYFRLEGEFGYKHGAINSITDRSDNYKYHSVEGDIGSLSMMFNAFLDLHNSSPVTPYLGGGVGFATLYISDTFGTNSRNGVTTRDQLYINDYASVLAYQVGGGMELELNSLLSLDLGYRYFVTEKGTFNNNWDRSTEAKFESHNVALGLRLKF